MLAPVHMHASLLVQIWRLEPGGARTHLSAVANDDANAVACCRTAIPPFDDPTGCVWVSTGLAMTLAALSFLLAMLPALLASIPSRVTAAS